MKKIAGAIASIAALSLAAPAAAQDIPVLVEEAAAAGWAYGDNGNITTPQTDSEEADCGSTWLMLDKAYSEGSFDADLVAAMPAQMNPSAAKKELSAWAKRLEKRLGDPMAAFQAGVADKRYYGMQLGKAAAGDPQAMFILAWNTRGCLIATAE
ncbi:hypothetical protein [Croceicoccus naphthovorans]|uniref:Uncharacterized protein n=1 Tax=Croceicoccus naphthovorans TaxID=1348774 RepID=A0A0G3XCS2_9SPHN|nr:hypothetical protein [Croceicoccus naphthovorans]AKM09355.1 hypothetical protein AB433_04130 [Croceicoccus naphthovorans]MBB3990270.1 hypothetical protein [Croceicoccus naphthovorans]